VVVSGDLGAAKDSWESWLFALRSRWQRGRRLRHLLDWTIVFVVAFAIMFGMMAITIETNPGFLLLSVIVAALFDLTFLIMSIRHIQERTRAEKSH
jgi:hypothetical protein